jgi:hypothetical protein
VEGAGPNCYFRYYQRHWRGGSDGTYTTRQSPAVDVCAATGSYGQGSSPAESVGTLLAAWSKAAGAAEACLQISRHPRQPVQ